MADRDDCPRPPSLLPHQETPDPDVLGFAPQPMVKWFTPAELARAGIEAVVSALFGAYADNRELQAVRGDVSTHHYDHLDEVWLDYTADLGDGFDSTYSIARLLAEPVLTLDDGATRTDRGRLLVLGGDQVYPTAKRDEYRDRFRGPYKAALPCVPEDAGERPHLYAVPGNHDWYDGLTSFTRLFCQNRSVGGWETKQRRSYFAISLPHNWWLWAVDVQLHADLDQPQWDYFRELGAAIPKGARIILCTAEPTWHTEYAKPGSYESMAWFEEHAMRPHGHRLVVGLAGDLHAYARWASDDGRQRFIAGGGGAYLYPTHRFPDTIQTPTTATPRSDRDTFTLGGPDRDAETALYPPREVSRKLARKASWFVAHNPLFAAFFGALYGVLAWLIQSASKSSNAAPLSFFETLAGEEAAKAGVVGVWGHILYLIKIVGHAPLAFLTVGLMLAGLIAFADGRIKGDGLVRTRWRAENADSWLRKAIIGSAHTAAHLAAFLLVCWLLIWVNVNVVGFVPNKLDAIEHVALFAGQIVLLGGLTAGFVWGFYLVLSNRYRRHTNEVFASQSIPHWKNLLRLHIDKTGALTIYPIGIEAVPQSWRYRADAEPGQPWFEAEGTPVVDRAELIEPPIRVPDGAGLRSGGDGVASGEVALDTETV